MNEAFVKRILHKLDISDVDSKLLQICQISGGRQHITFKIAMASGAQYVLKQLNFNCYFGEYSIEHFNASEQFAAYVSAHLGGALAAYKCNDQYVLTEDDKSYLIYPWCEGKTLHNLNIKQANLLGSYLAKIHALPPLDLPLKVIPFAPFKITLWSSLVADGLINNKQKEALIILAKQCEQARQKYQGNRVISHRDMNLDNILWLSEKEIKLIDWESSGYISPFVDLLGLAVNVGGIGQGHLDLELVQATINAYQRCCFQRVPMDESLFFQSYATWFSWLDYCLSNTDMAPELSKIEIQLTLKSIELLIKYQNKICRLFIG